MTDNPNPTCPNCAPGYDCEAGIYTPKRTDLTPMHDAIALLSADIRRSQESLAALLLAVCPGPHRLVQHRDRRPPWCKACRYTSDGRQVAR
jgi:hypothetical protein